jgi:hypothetical protein
MAGPITPAAARGGANLRGGRLCRRGLSRVTSLLPWKTAPKVRSSSFRTRSFSSELARVGEAWRPHPPAGQRPSGGQLVPIEAHAG